MPRNNIFIKYLFFPPVFRLCLLFCFVAGSAKAQPPAFKMQSYIELHAEEAVFQMLQYRVPASVTMAQAIFESRSGGSELARKANNHFGIKCHIEWGGDTVVKDDDTLNECFRKYRCISDSYTDHSMFLRSRARYASLFELPLDDYRSWCYGLKAAGYATYPSYAEELVNIIEQLGLYELDGYHPLETLNVFDQREYALRAGPDPPDCGLMNDFFKLGLLWVDEKKAPVQSLETLVDNDTLDEYELTER